MNPKNWYRDCGNAIRKEFGNDADLFIDILAATSPRKQISANWRLAMRIYHIWNSQPLSLRVSGIENWIRFRDFYDNLMIGTLPAHRKNIIRALQRKELSGNKVRAFAANLKGDLGQITIDVWICRWYEQPVKTLTNKVYEQLSNQIRDEAKAHRCKPAEWQAIIWCKSIEMFGRTPKSFLTVPDRGQQYFEFYYLED